MNTPAVHNPNPEGGSEPATNPAAAEDSAPWFKEITAAEKELEKFQTQGRAINDRYLDKRNQGDETAKKLNLFYANTQILLSTLYARFPKPLVTREHEDEDDDVARVAGTMLERLLKIKKRDDFDESMRMVVQDRLVTGLAQVWLRYEPTIVPTTIPAVTDDMGNVTAPAQEAQRIVDERVAVDYVHWEDFIWSPARVWGEVRWVGRKVKMIREDVEKRFGAEVAKNCVYQKGVVGDSATADDRNENYSVQYAVIYEIWDKRSRKVYWVAKGCMYCIDVRQDPLKLENFWPCPRPMRGLTSTSSTVPRADFLMIQDQYLELDSVNARIADLEDQVRVLGVYDKNVPEIATLLSGGGSRMVGANNFGQFADKGGFKGMVDWMPLDAIVAAIDKLREARQDLIAQIYEMTGISDIMRGSTKASETLGAQQLKAQYGSVRLQFLQMEVAEFVEEVLQLKSQIIRTRFQPQTIMTRANVQFMTNDQQHIQPAMQLLQDPTCEFRIEVHADSMAVPEFNAERDGRMAYIRAIGEFINNFTPILQTKPEVAPYLIKLMSWGAASFRTGRTIEGVLDQAIQAIQMAAANPPPPPPPTGEEKLKSAQAVKTIAEAEKTTVETNHLVAHPPTTEDKPAGGKFPA